MSSIPLITDMDIDHETLVAHQEGRVNHVFHVFCNAECVNDMVASGASPRDPQCCVSGIIYKPRIVPPSSVTPSRPQFGDVSFDKFASSLFNPTYDVRVPNGATLLKHIIYCMSSPDFKLAKFDVRLTDQVYMNTYKPVQHGLNIFKGPKIISLPRLVLTNANQMLGEILSNDANAPNVSVFFYNHEYPTNSPPFDNLFVIYPIPSRLQNYNSMQQEYLNSFFKLFKHSEKARFVKGELDLRKNEMREKPEATDEVATLMANRFGRDQEAFRLDLPTIRVVSELPGTANRLEGYFHNNNENGWPGPPPPPFVQPPPPGSTGATGAPPPLPEPQPQPQPQSSFWNKVSDRLFPFMGGRTKRSKRSKKHSKQSKQSNRKGPRRSSKRHRKHF